MPKYYVYDAKTGEVVHVHEEYDATSGRSQSASEEAIMELVDETLDKGQLKILEMEGESQPATGVMRIDPKARTLVTADKDQ